MRSFPQNFDHVELKEKDSLKDRRGYTSWESGPFQRRNDISSRVT